jgi:hypothetical protein
VNKDKNAWRKWLKAGDLVKMKSGHLAVLTEVYMRFTGPNGTEYPHVKILYCDDQSIGGCSAWRIEEVLNEAR